MCPSGRSRVARAFAVAVLATVACTLPFDNRYQRYGGPADLKLDTLSCRSTLPPSAEVRWIELQDSAESGVIARWCETVGPALVANHTPGGARVAAIDSLFVISWNVHVGGGDVAGLVDDLRSGELTGGRPVQHFVLMLQEAYRAGPHVPDVEREFVPKRIDEAPPNGIRADVVAMASDLRLWLFYVPSMRNGNPDEGGAHEDRGNALLSTSPLTDLTAVELPFERTRRVPIAATLVARTSSGREWRLRLANVHLANRAQLSYNLAGAGIVGRLRQARAVCAAFTETPVVVGGDFNTWAPGPIERSIPLMRRHFPLPRSLGRQPTFAARFAPDRRIDYFFFRLEDGESAAYRRIDRRYGSDHYPLIATVRARPSG